MDIRSIIEALGSRDIQAALGVTEQSVRMARLRGRFPASWYLALNDLAEARGVKIPDKRFAMRPAKRGAMARDG